MTADGDFLLLYCTKENARFCSFCRFDQKSMICIPKYFKMGHTRVYNILNNGKISLGIAMPKNRKEFPNMRKEYESPMCKVVMVEKKDVLTLSDTTTFRLVDKNGGDGNFDSNYKGGYVGWNIFG